MQDVYNMKKIFINFTNHPSDRWEDNQIAEAEKYGKIMDFPFPLVKADCGENEIKALAEVCCEKIQSYEPAAVLCQGEFCLAYQVIKMLKENGVTVLAACSQRDVVEQKKDDGSMEKTAIFRFVRFREYGD